MASASIQYPAPQGLPEQVAQSYNDLDDSTCTIEDSRDTLADFDASFRTSTTQHSTYTLNDGNTTVDEQEYEDKEGFGMDIEEEADDENHGLTASQIETKEKKRRRRTNKDEASVLGAVFAQTAFPDVHTRTALAERLQMDLRSVSIWFQNKRQAMKKRASRYGGIDGISCIHGNDDKEESELIHANARQIKMPASGLRRWASLDDVAGRALSSQIELPSPVGARTSNDTVVQIQETQRRVMAMMQPTPIPPQQKASTAPLLDALRNCHRAVPSRDVSLPLVVSHALLAPDEREKQHDLRELLFGAVAAKPRRVSSLQRSASMVHLTVKSNAETTASSPHENRACATRLDVGPASPDPIWKHMLSSSSTGTMSGSDFSSEALTAESDKENRQSHSRAQDVAMEDEEQTLRKIANKRAAREKLRLEQKLSNEGAKYIQEADARLVLQQQNGNAKSDARRVPFDSLTKRDPLSTFRRSVSMISNGQKSALARVASLDLSAGRDRSKAPGKALMQVLDEFERERHRRITERRLADVARKSAEAEAAAAARKSKAHNVLRRVHSTPGCADLSPSMNASSASDNAQYLHQSCFGHRGLLERHMSMTGAMTRVPSIVRSSSGSLSLLPSSRPMSRIYSTSQLMPGLMARHLENKPRLPEYADHLSSSAFKDMLDIPRHGHSWSASRNSSTRSSRSSSDEGTSEGWTESWAREQRSFAMRSSSERERSFEEVPVRPTITKANGDSTSGGRKAHDIRMGSKSAANKTKPVEASENGENDENIPMPASLAPKPKKRRIEEVDAPTQRMPLGAKSINTTSTRVLRSPLRSIGSTGAPGNRMAVHTASPSSTTSSPFKRGDERDRLAAETLLGLGLNN